MSDPVDATARQATGDRELSERDRLAQLTPDEVIEVCIVRMKLLDGLCGAVDDFLPAHDATRQRWTHGEKAERAKALAVRDQSIKRMRAMRAAVHAPRPRPR